MGVLRAFGGVKRVVQGPGESAAASKNCSDLQSIEVRRREYDIFFVGKLLIPVSEAEFLVHNAVPFRISFGVCVCTGPTDFVYFNQPRKKTTM